MARGGWVPRPLARSHGGADGSLASGADRGRSSALHGQGWVACAPAAMQRGASSGPRPSAAWGELRPRPFAVGERRTQPQRDCKRRKKGTNAAKRGLHVNDPTHFQIFFQPNTKLRSIQPSNQTRDEFSLTRKTGSGPTHPTSRGTKHMVRKPLWTGKYKS